MTKDNRSEHSLATTVLIPVLLRNGSAEEIQLLRRALESVNDQRFPDAFEILLVDDGSPTPVVSHETALGAAARKVRWMRLDTDQGVTNALNRGLIAAKFPFVARLDADDIWRHRKIEKQFARFAADPDLTICATGMILVSPTGAMLSEHIRQTGWSNILRFYVEGGCPFPHGSVLARRDIYLELGGYPYLASCEHCEDYALWGTWLRFFKPSMIEEVLYEYTVSPSNISNMHAEKQRDGSFVLRKHFERLGLITSLPTALSEFTAVLGISAIQAGILAFRIWRYGIAVYLPMDAVAPLRQILPDRDIECLQHCDVVSTPAQVLSEVSTSNLTATSAIIVAHPI